MIKKLKTLLTHAYAPYSQINVGAIVITKHGQECAGVNIENASYGATICAERSALSAAITGGTKPGGVREMHVYSSLGKALYPCSLCLQMMVEFFDTNSKIYIYGGKKKIETSIDQLVPFKVTKASF